MYFLQRKFIAFNKKSLIQSNKGFSLIEMMVALVIGLVVSLAIYGVISVSESRKRTTTSVNDIDKAGAYAAFEIDQAIRSAGSGLIGGINVGGLIQAASYTLGCELYAAQKSTPVLPAPGKLPSPFDSLPTPLNSDPISFRLAPVIILADAAGVLGVGGDVLITMAGSSGLSEIATNFSVAPTSTSTINLKNVANLTADDRILIAQAPSATAMSPCLLQQVASSFTPAPSVSAVTLAGDYYMASINGLSVSAYPATSVVLNLGKEPSFSMFGVGVNNTLYKYDLLSVPDLEATNNQNPSPLVDSVYQMRALYGVYTTPNDPSTLAWQAPTGIYSAETLLSGTSASITTLSNIKAIKIGLVMKTSLPENPKNGAVSDKSLVLFSDTKVPVTVTLDETNYRYRAIEVTVPIRNALML